MVDLRPLDIVEVELGVNHAVDVVNDAELVEGQFEEGALGGVVGVD